MTRKGLEGSVGRIIIPSFYFEDRPNRKTELRGFIKKSSSTPFRVEEVHVFLFEELYYPCRWRACYRWIYWNMSYNCQSIISGNRLIRLFGLRARVLPGYDCRSSDVVFTMGATNFRIPSLKARLEVNVGIHFSLITF